MTEPPELALAVPLDDRWFELPVQPGSDVDAWAAQAVERALALRGAAETEGRRRVWEQMFAAEVDLVTADVDATRELVAAYLLVPAADVVPVTVVSVQAAWVGPGGVDRAVEGLVAPEEQRYGPPEVDELATPAGTCVRVRQVLVEPDGGADPVLRNAVAYVWDLPDPELVLVAAAVFGSPSDAAVYGEAVDELASGVALVPA